MSETKKKRRFWSVHLSTAVLLMFAAGASIWANTLERGTYLTNYRGWPLPAVETRLDTGIHPPLWSGPRYYEPTISAFGIGIDSLVAIGTLVAVAFVSEWLIRRRETRRR
jgi:hypothetical protein